MIDVGTVIADRYELRERLGVGGMGEVYRAYDRRFRLDVAIKALLPHVSRDEQLVERFLREGRTLALLRHPGIIGIFDMLQHEGSDFLVLEFVPGQSLEDELGGGRMPWSRCADIGAQVCGALAAAHARDVVHRDIKPSNILLEPSGMVRVADFGIARLATNVSQVTRAGMSMGTPGFWAPEQALGQVSTAQSDLYSLGAVLFLAGTGRLPFVAEEEGPAAAYLNVTRPVPDPREVAPDLPAAAAELIVRALAKDPSERFHSAIEMARALRVSAGLPLVPVTPFETRLPDPEELRAGPPEKEPPEGTSAAGAPRTVHVTDEGGPLDLEGTREDATARRVRSLPGSRGVEAATPLVGRAPELRELSGLLASAEDPPRVVMAVVIGDPGVGKSRLASEVAAACSPDASVIVARALPYGEGISFWPLREIVVAASGGEDEAGIGALLGGDLAAARLLATVVGSGEEAEATVEEIAAAARGLLQAVAARGPTLIVLEDMQSAEPAFLDLVENLLACRVAHPVLLLALARPELLEARPGWGEAGAIDTVLRLAALSEAEATALLSWAGGPLTHEGRRKILRVAAGNPLVIEQMAVLAAETSDPAGAGLPSTIEMVLAARLDRLGPGERRAAEAAAVVGREFWPSAVGALLEGDDVSADLDGLARKALIERGGLPFDDEPASRFRHGLIRDAVYEAIPVARRALLHEGFAVWLEGKVGDRAAAYEEILGYHLEQAWRYRSTLHPSDSGTSRLRTKAAARLISAGRRAAARRDPEAAGKLLERARASTGAPPRVTNVLAPGRRLRDFRIEREVGRGAHGIVYLANQMGLDRAVALKALSPKNAADAGFVGRLRDELAAVVRLDHPHVIPIYDVADHEGVVYVAMKWVDGPSLADLMPHERPAPEHAMAFLAQVADALESAHRVGLMHGGVAPSNVLVHEYHDAFLSDFGFVPASLGSAAPRPGARAGALEYLAPERLRGEPPAPAGDRYSLGAIAYELVAGRPPFDDENRARLMHALLNDAPPAASLLEPSVTTAADDLLAAALAKEPERRPSDARAFVRGLADALGVAITTPPRRRPTPPDQAQPDVGPGAGEPGRRRWWRPRGGEGS